MELENHNSWYTSPDGVIDSAVHMDYVSCVGDVKRIALSVEKNVGDLLIVVHIVDER